MKALVTGASGFIGSHVADLLIAKGIDVKCTVRKSSSHKWLENKPVELINASLFDTDALADAVKDVDYIYHVAGMTFARNEEEFLHGNRDGTRNLLEIAQKHAPNLKKFLFVSSQTVAGPAKSLTMPVSEEMTPNPLTAYARSKKAAEDEVRKYMNSLPCTIVRAPAVFGPRDTAIFSIFKACKMGLGMLIGFDEKFVSLINSSDLSRGIIEAAESPNTLNNTYFVSSEEFYTWDQILTIIRDAMGKKFFFKLKLPHSAVLGIAGVSEFFGKFSSKPPVFNYEKGIDFIQKYWICSVENAKRDFGYSQQISIEKGIEETVRWYIDNKWL